MNSEFDLLQTLRQQARARRARAPVVVVGPPLTAGQRAADVVATVMGSWQFIIVQSIILLAWIGWNAASGAKFDPYPFILLNLALSFQAAYSAPIIMMSQNRQSDIDRGRAIQDYDVNCKAEVEIETLHQKIDLLKEQEIAQLITAVEKLTEVLEKRV